MIDERFAALREMRAPDLWHDIERRTPSPPEGPRPASRLAVAVVTFTVFLAAFALLVAGFRGETIRRAPAATMSNGEIVFRVGGGDAGSWWESVMPDGTSRRRLFEEHAELNVADVAWHPDGQRIAFVNYLAGDAAGIYVSDADGSNVVRLTDGENDADPAWSPDGSRIVFASTGRDADEERCMPGDDVGWLTLCPTDLYVMNADGSDLRQLTRTTEHEGAPAWSPDGSTVAYSMVPAAPSGDLGLGPAIYAIDAAGGEPRPLVVGDGQHWGPSWSPDGRSLVFTSTRPDSLLVVSVSSSAGTDVRSLFDQRGLTGYGMGGPVWSPDGRQIAFVGDASIGEDLPDDAALMVANADGSDVRIVAEAPRYGVSGDLAWRPLVDADSETDPSQVRPQPSTADPGIDVPLRTVPSVVGWKHQRALIALDELGFEFDVLFRESNDEEPWSVVSTDPPAGSEAPKGSRIEVVVRTSISPLWPTWAEQLSCTDHEAFGGPRFVLLPSGESFIRANVGGTLPSDEVAPAPDLIGDMWQVVRDGGVVAVIDYESLDGVACTGSGIAGT